jgi:Domain of unknown function (DUF4249)
MKKLLFGLFILLVAGCKEKYESPATSPITGYLVVEGIVNGGKGSTILTLSRTTKLDNRAIQYEEGAQVKVEGEDNSVYFITETGPGKYVANNLNLLVGRKYRLRIKTNNGKEYLSDYEAVRTTPPIDSISWKRESEGLQLYVNTHDDQDNTRYYQWTYDETWEIHSAFKSALKYFITQIPPNDDIYSV